MRLSRAEARARLDAQVHGVLCTLHAERGPDPVPVVYAVSGDGHVGVPIDTVKPKTSSRLGREANLEDDPRGSLLVEHWETEDWSRLWWVRVELEHVPDPGTALTDELGGRLARAVPQYADRPFHHVLVCRIVGITGWAATEDETTGGRPG
ncbi:TIGR03668 family PPOX class F420-dependent oxidoreductase [Terrabacter aerolatus]|uniref:PPOX class F420-dependent oxidoreductase n=1 Tax=Terrabacter aerolatus TaxID=422442 RepID=A0A512CW57_9MICO|nr:pyridoxamine 5'-phosphate oxidase family protein [Terrabacter aerolatus]GEO28444.1 PPOX class F420-dependent oxidoreductase [Terrabacter aerolatus]